ncbi:hypothetical protein J4E81_002565 [Alternaria sp. BMP 2799]|uniref:uncharacterized protein n=1 Tax=Alternaria conjuncta TaxID=181017 RepID=UPI00221E455B|nr:uncharacterized protein J4E85_006838 [Alternaria conjuncta]KAI4625638.1 hypothetical protein J4E80_002770 [Alternaria sp. BMP 0032]KAI4702203.1 hypothetical protein J4E81_002565 [Alternaria sp. BMP 2799]KAI4926544.1 hypothetical protein J4E85_006838 [Alternaria conjuncta]
MTYTRKQVVTCISVLYLVIATALAGWAASRANARSVPISDTLTGFTTALPIVSGLLLECGYDFTRRQERRKHLGRGEIQRPPLVIIANTLIFIYSSVVITLVGTHAAPPSGLDCGLRERWQTLFKHKDASAIRQIQDAFECCGLANARDMAWPFPDKTHKADACQITYAGRADGCFRFWKAEEQVVAGMLMSVVGMVFIWQILIIAIPTQKESWLHRIAPERISRMIADERNGDTEPRRAIDYIPGYNSNRYSDRIEEETEEDSQDSVRAIEEGNRRLDGALPGHVERDQQPSVENEWARN